MTAPTLTWRPAVLARRLALGLPGTVPHGRPPRGDVSPTRLKTLDTCRLQFANRYQDRLVAAEVGEARPLGKLNHRVLERLGLDRLTEQGERQPDEPVTLPELRRELENAAATYQVEPAAFRRAHALLLAARPRMDFSATIALEEPFTIQVPGVTPVATMVGVFDRVDVDAAGVVTVWDYKTGAYVPTSDEFAEGVQATTYAAVARRLFPTQRPRVRFWFLQDRNRTPFTLEWSETVDDLAMSYARRYRATVRAAGATWPATTGPHCVRCDYAPRCGPYAAAHAPATDAAAVAALPTPLAVALTGDGALLTGYREAATRAAAWEDRRKGLGAVLRERVDELGGEVLGAGLRAKSITPERHRLPALELAVNTLAAALAAEGLARPVDEIRHALDALDPAGLERFLVGYRSDVRAKLEAALDAVSAPYSSYTYVDVKPIGGPF